MELWSSTCVASSWSSPRSKSSKSSKSSAPASCVEEALALPAAACFAESPTAVGSSVKSMEAGLLNWAAAGPVGTFGDGASDSVGTTAVSSGLLGGKFDVAEPTFTEQGFDGFALDSWLGFMGPARMPRPVVDKLVTALREITQTAEVRERLQALGFEPLGNTPEEFAAVQKSELAQWAALVNAAGVSIN